MRVLAKESIAWERPSQGADSICVIRKRAEYPSNAFDIPLADARLSPPGIKVLQRGLRNVSVKPKQHTFMISRETQPELSDATQTRLVLDGEVFCEVLKLHQRDLNHS